MATLLLTPGEPAGIGPELAVKLAQTPQPGVVAVANASLLADTAAQLQLPLVLHAWQPGDASPPLPAGALYCWDHPLAAPALPGLLNPANAGYVLATLASACDACAAGQAQAMVTGPVQKSVIADSGVAFSGHTEWLAQRLAAPEPVMMLLAGALRVALATTHLPLANVPAALTPASLRHALTVLHHDLQHKFGIAQPRILVAGLNPHAGENGHLGREEIEVIAPVLAELRLQGMHLTGPLAADTLFTPKYLDHADAVLAMYHDQGLPVLKYVGFGHAVNLTLGLPIIRTSVDHGVALDLAGKGLASLGSLHAAVALARQLASLPHV